MVLKQTISMHDVIKYFVRNIDNYNNGERVGMEVGTILNIVPTLLPGCTVLTGLKSYDAELFAIKGEDTVVKQTYLPVPSLSKRQQLFKGWILTVDQQTVKKGKKNNMTVIKLKSARGRVVVKGSKSNFRTMSIIYNKVVRGELYDA